MLNQNIKFYRKQKGYTQEVFAQELNVVRQTVSKWEKGYSVPDAVMLEKMAELFDISVGELLGDTEDKIGEKTDLKQISEQLSILNNQIANVLARKRRNRKIALIVLIVFFVIVFFLYKIFAFTSRPAVVDAINTKDLAAVELEDKLLDKAISDTIMSENASKYLPGECKTESHFVFDIIEKDDTITVYLIEDYTEFAFRNGFFTEISGGTSPAVFTFNKKDLKYELVKAEYAQDGSHNVSSIKKMFPKAIAKQIIAGLSVADRELIWIKQVKQAQDYLSSIDRNAVICKYGDIETEFLSDYGIETEVENKINGMGLRYDSTIGNHETIENNKRYVYQTEYDRLNDRINFTKFEYNTNTIIEFISVDGTTGEVVKNAPKPEKVKYIKGELSDDTKKTTTRAVY